MANVKTISNRPIFDAASAIAALDNSDTRKRIELYLALETAGASESTLSGDGAHVAEFAAGILTGWQGAAFLTRYLKAKTSGDGKTMVKGKVLERATGLMVDTEKSRRDWDTQVPAKIKTARTQYIAWVTAKSAPAVTEGEGEGAVTGAGSGGKGTGGTVRDVNDRIFQETEKLYIVANDDTRGKDLSCDRGELNAAFERIAGLLGREFKNVTKK